MNEKLKELYESGEFNVIRYEAEDPEDVRERNHAYLEKYIGTKWAQGPEGISES